MFNESNFRCLEEQNFYHTIVSAATGHYQIVIVHSLEDVLDVPGIALENDSCDQCLQHINKVLLFDSKEQAFKLVITMENDQQKQCTNHETIVTLLKEQCQTANIPLLFIQQTEFLTTERLQSMIAELVQPAAVFA